MDREIKFRAFNTHDKEWYSDGVAKQLLYRDTIGEKYDRDKWKIVEYPGLKDKNGKEIYEGDIIKHGAFVYEVMFAEYGWYARCKDAGISSEDLKKWLANGSEVIGNIYETPHLLNV